MLKSWVSVDVGNIGEAFDLHYPVVIGERPRVLLASWLCAAYLVRVLSLDVPQGMVITRSTTLH